MSTSDRPSTDRSREIVVGVDTSGPGRAALRIAIEEAAGTGRSVCAVMVWNPALLFSGPAPQYEPIGPVRADYRGQLEAIVRDVAGRATDLAGSATEEGVTVTAELLEGDPNLQLVRRADGASLLVLGSHGRTRVGSTILGSVGQACVRHATCPVLIVPPALVRDTDENPRASGAQEVGS